MAMIWMVVLVCFGGSAAQTAATDSRKEPAYKFDTSGVRLEGTLIERREFGPPGYGETPAKDKRLKVLILKLPHPITIDPLTDAKAKGSMSLGTVEHVREVQLFVESTKLAEARKMMGMVVVSVGTLMVLSRSCTRTAQWMLKR
jgi:hypothetical protein